MADESEEPAAAQPEDSEAGPAPGRVNSQIVDAVSMLNTLAIGQAPAASAGMLGLVAADSLALGMLNAVARQQSDAVIAAAAVTAICARMAGTSLPAGPPQDIVREAEAQARAAILMLKTGAAAADGKAAKAALQRIAQAAAAAAAGPASGEGAAKRGKSEPPVAASRTGR
jgi:hypothetical protein